MKELLEIVEKYSGEIESGEKEMLRKMGMWMPEVPGFRKISLFWFLWDGLGRDKEMEVANLFLY